MVLSALQPAGRTAHGLRSMRSPQYSCTLTLHTRASPSSKLDIRRSAISVEDNVCCDYFDTFGADRFLLVHFKHIWDDNTLESVRREGLHELFESGLCLAGRHYAVLGGELAGRKEGAPEVGREGLESQALRLWFFAERDDCGGLRRIEVAQLIDWLGEFPRCKLRCRL